MYHQLSKAARLLFLALAFQACSTPQKTASTPDQPFVGTWKDPNHSNFSIIFTADGKFYNVRKKGNDENITHSGNFKVTGDDTYVLDITYELPGRKYALSGRQYLNHYQFSGDRKALKLTGTVYSKNGADTLNWVNNLVKVEAPKALSK